MKKELIMFAIAFSVLLTACSGGSNGNNTASTPGTSTTITMVVNKAYSMSSGQTIRKDSSPTEVMVETDVNTGESQATLTSGSASIITN